LKEELVSFSSFGYEKLGEFPLVEGSFRNLIGIDLPYRVSSFNDEILFLRTYLFLLLLLIDRGILSDFAARNKQEFKERSNYGKLKKY